MAMLTGSTDEDVARPPRRRRGLVASLLALVMVLGALTGVSSSAAADEPADRRYIDEVFDGVTATTDVVYGQAIDVHGNPVDLRLDVYQPAGDAATERPLLMWIHGGSFTGGDKAGGYDVGMASQFARQGYVAVSVGYRLGTATNWEAITMAYEDAGTAVEFLRANADTYRIDTDRVVATGASAGAITALNLAYWPVRADGEGTETDPRHVDAVVSLAGSTLPSYIEPGEPPAFLAHGTADTIVPFSGAQNTCEAALAAGIECVLDVYEGAGHIQLFLQSPAIVPKASTWLYDQLDLAAMTSISGTVSDEDGPVSGVVVRSAIPGDSMTLREAVTGPDGRYRISGLTAGAHVVGAGSPNGTRCFGLAGACIGEGLELVQVAEADETAAVDVALPSPGNTGGIGGTITDRTGDAVSGAQVWVFGIGFSSVALDISDAAGGYSVEGLGDGTYFVGVMHDGVVSCPGPQRCWAAIPLQVSNGSSLSDIDVVFP